jgi:hypothetical protein
MPIDHQDFVRGRMESSKWEHLREDYYRGLDQIRELGYEFEDYIHYFPCFVGHMTLARYLSIYECYKQTLGIAGNIAEVGVYRGACTLLLAKLCMLHEPAALTQVHGFDWFQGAAGHLSFEEKERFGDGSYCESEERLMSLIEAQQLGHLIRIHNMDMAGDAVKTFFTQYEHLTFKLVIFDAGIFAVVDNALPWFWQRLSKGGIIIFDQYNMDIAPGETMAVRKHLPDVQIRTFPNGWTPTAYVKK